TARVLGFTILDLRDQGGDIRRICSQRPGRDLPVKDLCSDIGGVGRCLTPAHLAPGRRQPHETDVVLMESFGRSDPAELDPAGARWQVGRHHRSWSCREPPGKDSRTESSAQRGTVEVTILLGANSKAFDAMRDAEINALTFRAYRD